MLRKYVLSVKKNSKIVVIGSLGASIGDETWDIEDRVHGVVHKLHSNKIPVGQLTTICEGGPEVK